MAKRPTLDEQTTELIGDIHDLADRVDELAVMAFDAGDVKTLTRLQRALARIVARETTEKTT